MSAKYAREVEELETQIRRKDREKRGLEDELRESREELARERETIRDLKVSTVKELACRTHQQRAMAEQSTQHLTINAQLAAAQVQQTALQAEIERATLHVSSMKAELEVGRQAAREAEERAAAMATNAEEEASRRVAEIEEELRQAETIRRKLHNQVQELKGESSSSCGGLS